MKKCSYYLSILISFFCLLLSANAIELDIYSKNAYLYNLDEQKVLYEKNANEQIAIASLTKLMTAIVAIEQIDSLDTKVTLTSADFRGLAEANAAVAGFWVGQTVTYRDLLYGLLLPSGADAAQALTRLIAGGRVNFVNRMNEKATALGLTNTHFVNETGLDAEGHYSTLTEVAKIFQYALTKPELKEILTSKSYITSDGNLKLESTITKNINRYQISMDYLQGGKTGTTDNAGVCLASIASENGTNYLLVTARAPYTGKDPYNFYDAKTIYEYFIDHYEKKNLLNEGEQILSLNTEYATEDTVSFFSDSTYTKYVTKDFQKEDLEYSYEGLGSVKYDTESGTKLGVLNIYYQGERITTQDIIFIGSLQFDFTKYLNAHKEIVVAVAIILVLLIILIIFLWRKKRK